MSRSRVGSEAAVRDRTTVARLRLPSPGGPTRRWPHPPTHQQCTRGTRAGSPSADAASVCPLPDGCRLPGPFTAAPGTVLPAVQPPRRLCHPAGWLLLHGGTWWDVVPACVDSLPGGRIPPCTDSAHTGSCSLVLPPPRPLSPKPFSCISEPLPASQTFCLNSRSSNVSAQSLPVPVVRAPAFRLFRAKPWTWPWSLFFPPSKVNVSQKHLGCPQEASPEWDPSSRSLLPPSRARVTTLPS